MNLEITDQVTPVLARRQTQREDRTALHDEISTAVEKLVTDILLARSHKPNRLDGTSTGFWGRVRDSVVATADASSAICKLSPSQKTRPRLHIPGRRVFYLHTQEKVLAGKPTQP